MTRLSWSDEGMVNSLTPREIDVLRLVADGLSTKQVADQLGISFKTAATHRERILHKLGAHNAVQATRIAIRLGLARL